MYKLPLNVVYLVHGPVGFAADVHYLDTWKAMEECVNQGLANSIGLSNFNLKQVEEVKPSESFSLMEVNMSA